MDGVVEKFSKSKPPRDLSPVLKMAIKLSKKNCKISGVKVDVSVWRACYDQGFESKNGKIVKRFKGPFSEDRVLNWFITIKKENTKEGKKFLNSKEFIQTLDGGYFCLFVDSEA